VPDTLQMLREGLTDLSNGMITSKLISYQDMTEAIDAMSSYLRNQGIAGVLCFRTAREIYAARSFGAARHGSDIIKLHVPYTLYNNMKMYEPSVFPMPVPGAQGLVTELKNLPRYRIVNSGLKWIGEVNELPAHGVVHEEDMIQRRQGDESCSYAIYKNLPEDVQAYCEFVIYRKTIQSALVKQTESMYV